MVKGSKVKNCSVVSIEEFSEGLIFSLFDSSQNCYANSLHICSKLRILPQGNFRYYSRARPFKVNKNTLHLWACVKPCTPVISLKHLTWTKGSLLPEYLGLENWKSRGITTLIIFYERCDSLSSIILQLGAFRHPWNSSITWANWHTSSSSSMARSGFRTAAWSCSRTTASRCYLNSPSWVSNPSSWFI